MKSKGLPKTLSKNQLANMLNEMPNEPVYICVNHTKFDEDEGMEGTILPLDHVIYDHWENNIMIDVDFSKPRPLDDLIEIDKFRKELFEFFGFADKPGTHIWEEVSHYGSKKEFHLKKIDKSFIDNIIMVLDSCRKNL